MGILNLCMKKNPFSRTFHFILVIPFVVIMVLAATSLGTFIPLHRDIKDHAGSGDGAPRTCILFATPNRDEKVVEYRDDTSCDFMIWGQVAVGSLAVAVTAILIVKACIGTKAFSIFAIIECILCGIGFLFTLALGVVITIGTDDTCKAFEDVNKERDPDNEFQPCEDYEYHHTSGIEFYGALNTSRIVTWIEAGVLFFLLSWFGFVSIVKCCIWCSSHGKKAYGKMKKPTKV